MKDKYNGKRTKSIFLIGDSGEDRKIEERQF